MPDKPRDHRGELRQVMNYLAEAAADASDEELLAEAHEAGLDPDAEAEKIRSILLGVVSTFKKRKLHEAQEQYRVATASLLNKDYQLPKSPQDRRSRLTHILTAQPQTQGMLTVQFRELSQLSDEDVESALRKLAELGFLEEAETEEEG